MVTKQILLETLGRIAPENKAESWDNGGVQIFTGNEEVNVILTALEVTEEVIREAADKKADWIIVHHPLFFHPIQSIDAKEPVGKMALKLIQNKISLYAAHTSFDCAPGGNNDYLAALLGLGLEKDESREEGAAFLYISKPLKQAISLDRLCHKLQTALEIRSAIPYAGEMDRLIRRIGICCGAGSSCIGEAKAGGCDVLITGDLKYHDAQLAGQLGITVMDAGHFDTEKTFALNMADKLASAFGSDVEIFSSAIDQNPFRLWNVK